MKSQPKEQDPAVIGKQKMINHPKIFIGTLMILIVMGVGIGILVSQVQERVGKIFFQDMEWSVIFFNTILIFKWQTKLIYF